MEIESAIRQGGVLRVAIGAALVAKPDLAYGWVGATADARGTKVMVRGLGIRDLAIGAGTVASAGDSRDRRPWLLAAIASDAVDFFATLAGPDAPGRGPSLAIAGGSAVAGLVFLLAG
jgi:hypothetical protein